MVVVGSPKTFPSIPKGRGTTPGPSLGPTTSRPITAQIAMTKFMGHAPSLKRQAKKAVLRAAKAVWIEEQRRRELGERKVFLEDAFHAVIGRVFDAMVRDGHPASLCLGLQTLVLGGRHEAGDDLTMGCSKGLGVWVYAPAFELRIERRILVHEIVHVLDELRIGEAYSSIDTGVSMEEYRAQRCEVLARHYEERADEFFVEGK